MPTVNFFYQSNAHKAQLNELVDEAKSFISSELTCGEKVLDPSEISIRLIEVFGKGMIGKLEAEVTAHAFDERVQKQDEICLRIQKFLMDHIPDADVRVWLLLPQLGHSWN